MPDLGTQYFLTSVQQRDRLGTPGGGCAPLASLTWVIPTAGELTPSLTSPSPSCFCHCPPLATPCKGTVILPDNIWEPERKTLRATQMDLRNTALSAGQKGHIFA